MLVVAPNVLVVVVVEEGNGIQPILVIRPTHLHKRHVGGILHLPCKLHIHNIQLPVNVHTGFDIQRYPVIPL
jgi:hypothetical protein